jgi:hypothetical protein
MGGSLAGAFRLPSHPVSPLAAVARRMLLPRDAAGAVAVLRGQSLLAVDDPETGGLQAGDRLILMASAGNARR